MAAHRDGESSSFAPSSSKSDKMQSAMWQLRHALVISAICLFCAAPAAAEPWRDSIATATGSLNDKLVMLDRYYPTFPSLAQSAKFMELRARIGLDAFRPCFDLAPNAGPTPDRAAIISKISPASGRSR